MWILGLKGLTQEQFILENGVLAGTEKEYKNKTTRKFPARYF